MNTCSIIETQSIEHDRDRVDFYNEEGLVPAEIENQEKDRYHIVILM